MRLRWNPRLRRIDAELRQQRGVERIRSRMKILRAGVDNDVSATNIDRDALTLPPMASPNPIRMTSRWPSRSHASDTPAMPAPTMPPLRLGAAAVSRSARKGRSHASA